MQFNKHTHTHTHTHTSIASAAFFCLALTYDLYQLIPDPRVVSIGTAVANSSGYTVLQRSPWSAGAFLRDGMFWEQSGGGLTRQPVYTHGPFGDTAITTAVMEHKLRGLEEF